MYSKATTKTTNQLRLVRKAAIIYLKVKGNGHLVLICYKH